MLNGSNLLPVSPGCRGPTTAWLSPDVRGSCSSCRGISIPTRWGSGPSWSTHGWESCIQATGIRTFRIPMWLGDASLLSGNAAWQPGGNQEGPNPHMAARHHSHWLGMPLSAPWGSEGSQIPTWLPGNIVHLDCMYIELGLLTAIIPTSSRANDAGLPMQPRVLMNHIMPVVSIPPRSTLISFLYLFSYICISNKCDINVHPTTLTEFKHMILE